LGSVRQQELSTAAAPAYISRVSQHFYYPVRSIRCGSVTGQPLVERLLKQVRQQWSGTDNRKRRQPSQQSEGASEHDVDFVKVHHQYREPAEQKASPPKETTESTGRKE
jgi:hypothetical protein